MAAAKKKKKKASSGSFHAGWQRLVLSVSGPARPFVLVGAMVLVLAAAWCLVWYGAGVREYILASDDYLVTSQKIEITPLPKPEWIRTNIRAEAFRTASLDGPLSIMDDDLTERIHDAFSLHPWVAKVHHVRKHHPARVEVALDYRRPVCMVAVPGGLLPVDAGGVLLPVGDFSTVEAVRYPRLTGVDTVPTGTVGENWGDARVAGGAQLAETLRDHWGPWQLVRIVPSISSPMDLARGHTYTLITRGGTRILWGRAPGGDSPDELSTDEKLARLENYLAQYGTFEGVDAPQELDVRRLEPHRVSSQPQRPADVGSRR